MFLPVTTKHQIEIIESLAMEIWAEHYAPIIGKKQVDYMLDKFQSRQAISEQIKAGHLYFLIKKGNDFIGYIAVEPRKGELFLSKIYVKASERKKGQGKKAIRFIEKLAKEKGLKKISLTVNKNNTTSIKVYERLGFTNLGSVITDIGRGFVMDDYKMAKEV